MKQKLVLIAALLAFGICQAQKVKLKKDKVSVDGEHVMNYEKAGANVSVFDLEDNEILLIQWKDNGTPGNVDDDFWKVHFINEDIQVESEDWSRNGAFLMKGMAGKTIKWLIKDKVLGLDGKINVEKAELFFKKYDTNVTNRTVRN